MFQALVVQEVVLVLVELMAPGVPRLPLAGLMFASLLLLIGSVLEWVLPLSIVSVVVVIFALLLVGVIGLDRPRLIVNWLGLVMALMLVRVIGWFMTLLFARVLEVMMSLVFLLPVFLSSRASLLEMFLVLVKWLCLPKWVVEVFVLKAVSGVVVSC